MKPNNNKNDAEKDNRKRNPATRSQGTKLNCGPSSFFLKCFFKKSVKTAVPEDGNPPRAFVLTKLLEW